MYGRWFLITFFWIGLVAMVIALAALASPLIAVAIAVVGFIVFLVFAGTARTRQSENRRAETDLPRHQTKRGGAPASGEGAH